MSEFDQTEFAAKVALGSLDKAASVFSSSLGAVQDKLSVAMGVGFKKYRESAKERYGYVKTLLHRDKPIALESLYVPTYYGHDEEEFSDESLLKRLANPCRMLIQGTAGGGKSIFLRYVNLAACNSDAEVLPLFFEMKAVNDQPKKGLVEFLVESIQDHIPSIKEQNFKDLLDKRKIVLILDGFDEINFDFRDDYVKQLAELSRLHPNASIIASSRPDDSIASIESFHTFEVLPFRKEQALALLEKLPYDKVVKSKFIADIEKELYEKHKDFLSNPLLITMMLMTYQQFAEIPNKVHIFYQQAFFTLFSLHDSSKEVFKRKSYTDLPIDEFQRIFGCFCAMTYAQQKFTFSETTVREWIKAAIEAEMLEVEVKDFLKDLLESTCLLQKDGVEVFFAHRSFQEYFTAWYITRMDAKSAKRALDAVMKRAGADLVLPMAFEMNPALVEKAWSLPTIDALIKKIDAVKGEGEHPFKALSIFFVAIYFASEGRPWPIYAVPHLWANRLRALQKLYSRGLPELDAKASKKGWRALVARLRDDPGFGQDGTGLSASARARLEVSAEHSAVLTVSEMSPAMLEYIDVTPWNRAIAEWLPNLRQAVAKRVGGRDTSMQTMFNPRRRHG